MGLNRIVLLAGLMMSVFLVTVPAGTEDRVKNGTSGASYSLDDLYILALDQSETIKIANEEVFIAEKDKSRALSVLVPSITAFGNYSRSGTDQTTDPDVTGETFDITSDTTGWGVRFDQSFTLNGKELIALKISNANIDKSREDLTTVRETYFLRIAEAYYNVLRTQKGVEIARANVKRLEKHRESVSTRLKLDDVTKTDLYRAESELSDAQAKLIEDENRYSLSRSALKYLVNIPDDFVLKLPDTEETGGNLMDIESLKKDGLRMRPEIKSAEISQSVAEKSVRLKKGDRWPVLSIEGQYSKTSSSNDGTMGGTSLEYDQDVSGYMLGAKLTFTLFDGGLRNAEIKQSYARERQAKLSVDETRKKIVLEIQDAFLSVSTQKSRLKSLEDKLKFSRQNYTAVSELFKHGLSNSVDMMDANTLLVSSERELSDAEFGYKLSLLFLKRATGTLLGNYRN